MGGLPYATRVLGIIPHEFRMTKFKKKMNTQLSLPFKRKNLLEDHFLRYQVLLGNTLKCALTFIQKVQANDGIILFIGTRPDIKEIVKYVGFKTNSPYVNDRWLKGLLTNWENTSKSIHFYNIFLKKLGLRAKKKKRMWEPSLEKKKKKKKKK